MSVYDIHFENIRNMSQDYQHFRNRPRSACLSLKCCRADYSAIVSYGFFDERRMSRQYPSKKFVIHSSSGNIRKLHVPGQPNLFCIPARQFFLGDTGTVCD